MSAALKGVQRMFSSLGGSPQIMRGRRGRLRRRLSEGQLLHGLNYPHLSSIVVWFSKAPTGSPASKGCAQPQGEPTFFFARSDRTHIHISMARNVISTRCCRGVRRQKFLSASCKQFDNSSIIHCEFSPCDFIVFCGLEGCRVNSAQY